MAKNASNGTRAAQDAANRTIAARGPESFQDWIDQRLPDLTRDQQADAIRDSRVKDDS